MLITSLAHQGKARVAGWCHLDPPHPGHLLTTGHTSGPVHPASWAWILGAGQQESGFYLDVPPRKWWEVTYACGWKRKGREGKVKAWCLYLFAFIITGHFLISVHVLSSLGVIIIFASLRYRIPLRDAHSADSFLGMKQMPRKGAAGQLCVAPLSLWKRPRGANSHVARTSPVALSPHSCTVFTHIPLFCGL